MKDLYLGIDVSTTCTGIALIDSEGTLLKASFVYLDNYGTIYEKAQMVKRELQTYVGLNICCISVEQNLLGFRRGATSASTLISLARFNGIVSYVSSEVFGIDPVTIPVVTARKGLKIPHKKGEDVKLNVFKWVQEQEPSYQWPTRILKSGKRKGEVVFEKGVEDACDAYVMARAALQMKILSKKL